MTAGLLAMLRTGGPQDPQEAAASAIHGVNPSVQDPAFQAALQGFVQRCLVLGQAIMRGVPSATSPCDCVSHMTCRAAEAGPACVYAALRSHRAPAGHAGIALGLGLPQTTFEDAGTSAATSYWVRWGCAVPAEEALLLRLWHASQGHGMHARRRSQSPQPCPHAPRGGLPCTQQAESPCMRPPGAARNILPAAAGRLEPQGTRRCRRGPASGGAAQLRGALGLWAAHIRAAGGRRVRPAGAAQQALVVVDNTPQLGSPILQCLLKGWQTGAHLACCMCMAVTRGVQLPGRQLSGQPACHAQTSSKLVALSRPFLPPV